MAKVQLCNVVVLDNPSPFLNPFQFEITFECIEELKEGRYLQCVFINPSLFSKVGCNSNNFYSVCLFTNAKTSFYYTLSPS
jgi:hypothetical protein